MVKRRQAEINYHAALMDACTEHLSVLEMTLIAAAEQKRSTEAAANPSVETTEQKRRTKRQQTRAPRPAVAAGALSDRKHR